MRKTAFLFLLAASLLACENTKKNTSTLIITLCESYTLPELYGALLEANQQIRKKQLDTMAKIPSGSALLDKIIEAKANDSTSLQTIEDYPVFQVLYPNVGTDQNGNRTLNSTTIIGMSKDTAKLLQLLDQTDALFPNNIEWKFQKFYVDGIYYVVALKNNAEPINLAESDMDSIQVASLAFTPLGKIGEKLFGLGRTSGYLAKIKLKPNLSGKLKNKHYALFIKNNTRSLTGSVSNFQDNPNQYILLGKIDYAQFKLLKLKYPGRVTTKKQDGGIIP